MQNKYSEKSSMFKKLKDIWYDFTCWVWYRYRTVKPKSLEGHGWVDRDELMLHCAFQCLVDCVEQECIIASLYKHQPEIEKQISDLYQWWKYVYLVDIYPDPSKFADSNIYDLVDSKLIDLIKIRRYLWT